MPKPVSRVKRPLPVFCDCMRSQGSRGNAAEASQAQQVIDEAEKEGKLAQDAVVTEENLKTAGQSDEAVLSDAVTQNDLLTSIKR